LIATIAALVVITCEGVGLPERITLFRQGRETKGPKARLKRRLYRIPVIRAQAEDKITPVALEAVGTRGSNQNPEKMKLKEKITAANKVKKTPAPRVSAGRNALRKKQVIRDQSREAQNK